MDENGLIIRFSSYAKLTENFKHPWKHAVLWTSIQYCSGVRDLSNWRDISPETWKSP